MQCRSARAICATCTFLGLLSACAQPAGQPTAQQAPASVEERLRSLHADNARLSDRIAAVEIQLSATTTQAQLASIQSTLYRIGRFDPTEALYQRVDSPTGFGSFAVSVRDISALGDGVRVKLDMGNLTTAAFTGVKLELKYRPRHPDYSDSDKVIAWQTALKTKSVTLPETLLAGHWNPVMVTLPGIAVSQFGYLEVSVETNMISLVQR